MSFACTMNKEKDLYWEMWSRFKWVGVFPRLATSLRSAAAFFFSMLMIIHSKMQTLKKKYKSKYFQAFIYISDYLVPKTSWQIIFKQFKTLVLQK